MYMDEISRNQAEAVIADAIRICEIPAPTGQEEKRAQNVARSLQAIGWTVEVDPVGNVLSYWGFKRPSNPVVVMAHLDTVHQGIEDIKVQRNDNVLVGPGIADNSLSVAALLYLSRLFGQQELPLLLAATVGEENIGNLKGALQVVQECNPKEVIALEGGGIEHLIVEGPGSLRCKVELQGPGGHSWEDKDTPSANHALLHLLYEIESEQQCESWNIGKLEGGGIISARAGYASAEIEFRDYQESVLLQAGEAVHRALEKLPRGITGQCSELGSRPGGRTSQSHPLVQSALQARQKHGLSQETASASTDANAGYSRGIPSICIGLSKVGLLHTTSEWSDISQLQVALDCLVDTLQERLNAS